MRGLLQRLLDARPDVVLSRRTLLARAVLALVPDVSGIALVSPLKLNPSGSIHSPIPGLANMTDPARSGFTGVADPTGKHGTVVKNFHPSGLSDAHVTMGTTRDLPNDSESVAGCGWLYAKPSDLVLTGRDLILQLQMEVSPIWAISPKIVNGLYRVQFVERVNGVEHRHDLGPLPWGHWFYPVVDAKLANAGRVTCWFGVDGPPDTNQPPRYSVAGDTWQDGRDGHHTIGQHAEHSKAGAYTGYWSRFVRDTTPAAVAKLLAA